jgi:signal transduction histidine kinase
VNRIRRVAAAVRYLVVGLVLAVVCEGSLLVSLYAFVGSLVVVGLLAIPYLAAWNGRLAAFDRVRVARHLGIELPQRPVHTSGSWPARARQTIADPMTYRNGLWLITRAFVGQILGLVGLGLTLSVPFDLTLPLWFRMRNGRPFQVDAITINSYQDAIIWGATLAVITGALALLAVPCLADCDARLARRVLAVPERLALKERVVELSDTRAAALDAHGAELRRIERDLHDGAQARLVSIALRLGMAERTIAEDPHRAAQLLTEARSGAEDALAELRDIVRGMYPPILADRGLSGAVTALATRSAIPVSVSIDDIGRQPAAVEAAAYFVTAEALTNVSKHSGASRAIVRIHRENDMLLVEITDDGHGGADEKLGSGIDGIRRRTAALDGEMHLWSPLGGPTVIRVELPCGS